MTDELAFRISQLKQEGIKVVDSEDTILNYTIFVEDGFKIVCRGIYYTLFLENEQITKNDKFYAIINKIKHI